MKLKELRHWPPDCAACGGAVDNWASAGRSDDRWLHKECWIDRASRQTQPPLMSPVVSLDARKFPVILFLLLFHVGGGAAVMGWFMLGQFDYGTGGFVVLILGVAGLMTGLAGFALEITLRRRAELVRAELVRNGGWQALEES